MGREGSYFTHVSLGQVIFTGSLHDTQDRFTGGEWGSFLDLSWLIGEI